MSALTASAIAISHPFNGDPSSSCPKFDFAIVRRRAHGVRVSTGWSNPHREVST
jgi:hypothetical protein